MNTGVLWFIAVVVFLILEGITYQLISIYFALGSVGGLIMYLLGFEFVPQFIVFLAISAAALAMLRPMSKKLLKKKEIRTNVDSLIGERVYITKEVNNLRETGEGKIKGAYWTVRSDDGSIIEKDTVAVVERVEGVKLIVRISEG